MIKTQIKKILVPMDGSDNSLRGLDMAIFIARQCGATITGTYSHYLPSSSEFYSLKDLTKKVPREVADFMEKAKKRAAESGISFNYAIMEGDPKHSIIKLAHGKSKFDLIVIGSTGRGHASEFLFGSVSNHILHKAKIPVLLVK